MELVRGGCWLGLQPFTCHVGRSAICGGLHAMPPRLHDCISIVQKRGRNAGVCGRFAVMHAPNGRPPHHHRPETLPSPAPHLLVAPPPPPPPHVCIPMCALQVREVAAELEGSVASLELPRPQYLTHMAGQLTRAKAARSLPAFYETAAALPPPRRGAAGGARAEAEAAAAGGGAGGEPPLLQALVVAEMGALERLAAGLSSPPAPAASGAGGPDAAAVAARLEGLGVLRVGRELVAAGGAGKRLRKLSAHAHPAVAQAAGVALARWREQVAAPAPEPLPAAGVKLGVGARQA